MCANGREVLREQQGFNGSDGWIRTETHRDTYGRVLARSLPYFSGQQYVTDAGEQVASMTYDLFGRRTAITESNSGTTSFELDGLGQTNEQFDAKLQETRFSYDRLGCPTERIDGYGTAGSMTSTWAWDGNMTTSRTVDPNSGRVTAIETQKNAGSERIQHLLMTWRSDGALFRRTDLQGAGSSDDTQETFTYDPLDRVTQAVTRLGGGGTTRSLGYGYDAHGNLNSKTSSVSGDAETTGYNYASSSKPHRLTSATIGGAFTHFHYDARNQITRITVGATAGTPTPKARDEFWYGPDGARFLKRETWDDDSTPKQSLTVYLYGGIYEEVHPLHDGDSDWHRKLQASSAALIRFGLPRCLPGSA